MHLRLARELSSGRALLVCVVLAVLAAAGVAIAASPVPRVTPDSASYLTGAERLADGRGFEDCTGPIAVFAPGYSAAMAPLVAAGVGSPAAALVVNTAATVALVLGAAILAAAAGLSRGRCVLVALAVATSFATLRDGALVWSEPLFCALLAVLLVVAVDRGRGVRLRPSPRVGAALVLAWALLLTRHSGLFVAPAIVAAAWLGSAGLPRRLLRTGAFAVALLVVPAVWWARNVHVEGDAFGRRSASRFDALEVLSQVPDALSSLTLPNALPEALRLVALAPLAVAAALAWPRSRRDDRARVVVWVLGIAALAYGLGVTLAAMHTVVDPIDTRLLSPLLVPAAVLAAIGVTRARSLLGGVALVTIAATTVLAPGVVWRGHAAERSLANVPSDVSCADWPERYSGAAVGVALDRR